MISASQIVTNLVDHLSEIETLQSTQSLCMTFHTKDILMFFCITKIFHLNIPHSNFHLNLLARWTGRVTNQGTILPHKGPQVHCQYFDHESCRRPGTTRQFLNLIVSDREGKTTMWIPRRSGQSSRYYFLIVGSRKEWEQKPRKMQDIPVGKANDSSKPFKKHSVIKIYSSQGASLPLKPYFPISAALPKWSSKSHTWGFSNV